MGTSDEINPQNTDNLQDDTSNTISDNIQAVALVELSNGMLVMVTTERDTGHDGISTFEIDNDPASPTYGQIVNAGATDADAIIDSLQTSTEGAGYDQILAIGAITLSNGKTYVYTADPVNDTIGISEINSDGTLTALPGLTSTVDLDQVAGLTVMEVGGNAFVITRSTDDIVSYAIDPATGGLTEVTEFTSDGTTESLTDLAGESGAPTMIEGFTDSAGQGFVVSSDPSGALYLFTIDSSGTMAFQNARGDDQAGAGETDLSSNDLSGDLIAPAQTGLLGIDTAAFAEIDGETYVFVAGTDDDVTIFRIDDNAFGGSNYGFTLVGQQDNITTDISALQVITTSAGDNILAIGGEQQGLLFTQITVDPVTGVVTLDLVDSVTVADESEPGAELWDVEDLALHDKILVSASDLDDGVAVMTVMICFATGTQMMTEFGELPVQDLRVGDRLLTHDHGFQPVLWIGTRRVSGAELRDQPGWRPVRVARNAFGPNVPSRPLRLSRQHRVLVVPDPRDPGSEVLMPVKDCLALPGVSERTEGDGIRYFHILMPRHEIVFANGQPCETLWPGELVQGELTAQKGFPVLDMGRYTPGRTLVKGQAARQLVAGIAAAGQPMVPARFMRLDERAPVGARGSIRPLHQWG